MAYDYTKPTPVASAVLALVTLAIFCLLFWSMFSDSKIADCVTRARLGAIDTIKIHEVRWTPTGGCEYFASIENKDKVWLSLQMIMRDPNAR
jgi:hypothetical protein